MSRQFVASAPSEAISGKGGSPPPRYHDVVIQVSEEEASPKNEGIPNGVKKPVKKGCRCSLTVFQSLMIIAIISTIAFVVYNRESVETLKKIYGRNSNRISMIISKLGGDVKEGKEERDRDLERFQTMATSYNDKFKNMEINFEAIEEEIENNIKVFNNNFQTVDKKIDKLCEIMENCEMKMKWNEDPYGNQQLFWPWTRK